jgi:hypothetical protein
MRQILDAIREHLAKGRILSSKSFNLGHESADEMQSFVVHDRIPIEQYARDTFVGVNEQMEVVQMDSKFNVSISMVVTRDDGTPFAKFSNDYQNMSLEDVVELEAWAVEHVQNGLVQMGKDRLAKKQAKAADVGKGK